MARRDYSVSAKIKGRDEASSVFRRVGRGLRRYVGGPIRGINRGISGISRGLQAVPGATIIGGGIYAAGRSLIELATDTAEAGDSIAKTARRAGISAQSLQSLGYAAGIAGSSQERLNKGVQVFARNLGQLRAGTGPLKTLLDRVSPALRDMMLGAEDTESALRLMFDALGELDSDRRMTLAQAAFGRAGEELALIAEGGSEQLAKLEERFRRLGATIDDDALAASEEFNDQILDLKTAWGGLKRVFGGALIKEGLPHLRKLTAWIVDNKSRIGELASGFAQDVVGGMRSVGEALPGILQGLREAAAVLGKVFGFVYDVGASLSRAFGGDDAQGWTPQVRKEVEQQRSFIQSALAGQDWTAFAAMMREEGRAKSGILERAGSLEGLALLARESRGEVTVRFENAPAGMRPVAVKGPVRVEADVGRRPVTP